MGTERRSGTIRAGVLAVALLLVVASSSPTQTSAQEFAGTDAFPGTPIASLPYEALVHTENATNEPGEPLPPNSGGTLWFEFTATADGPVAVELGQAGDTGGHVTVYTGDTLDALTAVASGSTAAVGPWAVIFRAEAGTTYHLQVASADYEPPYAAKLTLRIEAGTAPHNDVFPGAAISTLPFTDTVDTTFATLDEDEPSVWGGTVWYSFTGPAGGATIQADTLGTRFASAFSIEDDDSLSVPGSGRGEMVTCGAARVVVDFVAEGEQVWFQVGSQGFPGERGELHFNVREVAAGTEARCPDDPAPATSPTPRPPGTGTGQESGGTSSAGWPAGAVGGLAVLTGAALFLRGRSSGGR